MPPSKETHALFGAGVRQEQTQWENLGWWRLTEALHPGHRLVRSKGGTHAQCAAELLDRLRSENVDPDAAAGWGDPIMLPTMVAGQTQLEIERAFGGDFATQVVALELGGWSGPI